MQLDSDLFKYYFNKLIMLKNVQLIGEIDAMYTHLVDICLPR